MKILMLILLVSSVLLSGCSSSESYDETYNPSDHTSSGYDSNNNDRITSDNWNCTGNCSGHEAGYEWASNKGISDPDECDGNSDSFIEGCQAYANEQQIEAEHENTDAQSEPSDDHDYGY
jgi:hypothetical protein